MISHSVALQFKREADSSLFTHNHKATAGVLINGHVYCNKVLNVYSRLDILQLLLHPGGQIQSFNFAQNSTHKKHTLS